MSLELDVGNGVNCRFTVPNLIRITICECVYRLLINEGDYRDGVRINKWVIKREKGEIMYTY